MVYLFVYSTNKGAMHLNAVSLVPSNLNQLGTYIIPYYAMIAYKINI